jgi:hypothetical protein
MLKPESGNGVAKDCLTIRTFRMRGGGWYVVWLCFMFRFIEGAKELDITWGKQSSGKCIGP